MNLAPFCGLTGSRHPCYTSAGMRVAFYQFYPKFGQVRKNLEWVLGTLKGTETDLVVLPELAFTGYLFENREEALGMSEEPETSPTLASLISLCRENDFYIVTGFAERDGVKVYNSALLVGPEGLIHTYRKIHLFNTEKDCFDPGDRPLQVIEVRGVNIGMMVCFDWAFPEVARVLALKGADILCHPANLVLPYCQRAMVTRCLENRVFAVTANRVGRETRPHGELTFTGMSQVTAPDGTILRRAGKEEESLSVVEIDPTAARNKHLTERNHLFRDRRPEFYEPLCQRKSPGNT